ncbi:MAG: IS66 family transposase [Elusimicrobiota bacterium]
MKAALRSRPRIVDLDPRQIDDALAQAKTLLPEPEYQVLATVVEAYRYVLGQLARKRASLGRLRRMLFGPLTEKTSELLGPAETQGRGLAAGLVPNPGAGKPRPRGHGRNGAADYPQAMKVAVPHGRLEAGDHCPGCRKGKVYKQAEPGVLVRIRGQAPVEATIYELGKLRCNLCGQIYTARPPEGVGAKKYDETSASMVGLLKYGSGVPFHRLDRLQDSLGVPLPATTQWEIVSDAARALEPAYEELVRQAAQGKVLHNDDTSMKILARMGRRSQGPEDAAGNGGSKAKNGRTGTFTSGIVSTAQGRRIALFFTGGRHAGENLEAVLAKRSSDLARPIQMCDAASRNAPSGKLKTFLANCLAHGRRKFVELLENFPAECAHVLRVLRQIYIHDALARRRAMSPAERLRYHQKKSGPLMQKLREWMRRQFAEKLVEPNSSLGEAIGYMLKHWAGLTLFLRRPGAPLDNNIVERALKKAILHRKNALFYKTDNGARVGDLYMTLIHTCEMNGADPFDYLTQVQRHAKDVRQRPERWLPWTYPKATPHAGGP